jgi:hypothetical protein
MHNVGNKGSSRWWEAPEFDDADPQVLQQMIVDGGPYDDDYEPGYPPFNHTFLKALLRNLRAETAHRCFGNVVPHEGSYRSCIANHEDAELLRVAIVEFTTAEANDPDLEVVTVSEDRRVKQVRSVRVMPRRVGGD